MSIVNENRYQQNGINFYILTYNYYKNGKFEQMQWHCKSSYGSLQEADAKKRIEIGKKLKQEFPDDIYALEMVSDHSYPIYKELFAELGGIVERD